MEYFSRGVKYGTKEDQFKMEGKAKQTSMILLKTAGVVLRFTNLGRWTFKIKIRVIPPEIATIINSFKDKVTIFQTRTLELQN